MARSRFLIIQILLAAAPAAAVAEPTQEFRCTVDSLEPAEALQRLEWARKCGLIRNTGPTLNSGDPANWFESATALDAATLPAMPTGAKEYREKDTADGHRYTGNLNDYNVNYYYAYARYTTSFKYTVSQETTGPTAGFWKWSHTTQRPRPLYPTFDTDFFGGGTMVLPLPSLFNDCNLYQRDAATGTLTPWTGTAYVVAYCESSCYAPDQSLRFADGDVNIVEAMRVKRDNLVTLDPDATLDNLATQTSKVFSYTTEIRDAEHVIYKITTASGGSLKVTNEHPMVTSEGRLVKAEKLTEGDELLKADGTPDAIVSVEKTSHFGKVYNIKPASREPVANILIAQGYLVGSARFQNDDVGYMNRVLLFRGIPGDIIPR